MNHNPEQICENCLYFQLKPGVRNNDGFCKRHPPVRLEPEERGRSSIPRSTYPTVPQGEWCGHWSTAWTPAVSPAKKPEPSTGKQA